jgi:hypothetical protein
LAKREPGSESDRPAPDLFSSAETRRLVEEFRALVRAGVLRITPDNDVLIVREEPVEPPSAPQAPPATAEEIEQVDRQLLEYLERNRERRTRESRTGAPEPTDVKLRQRAVDKVAEKIMERWYSAGEEAALRQEVVDRVVDLILQRWDRDLN